MTKTIRRPDATAVFSDLSTRIRKLEQLASGPSVAQQPTDPKYNSVTIGGVPVFGGANPPTDLVLTTGSFYDDIFVDAKWTAPTDGSAIAYDIDLAKKNADGTYQLQQTYRSGSTSIRINALQASVTYGVRVYGVNKIGIRSSSLPASNAYKDIISAVDATVPPAVTGVTIARGATSAIVKFTPLTAAQAPDVANGNGIYEVFVFDTTFGSTIGLKFTNDQVVAFNDVTAEWTVSARVRAIDASGNAGPWSADATAAKVGAVIDSMIVAGLDAAKITVGELDASRIKAGTMDVNRLKSSSLTTQTIDLAGGQFRVISADVTRMIINSQGISLFNGSGVRTIFLDTANGQGTFQGAITGSTIAGTTITGGIVRTASSGARVELNPTAFGAAIGISSGVTAETQLGRVQAGAGTGFSQILLRAPRQGDGQYGELFLNGLDTNALTTRLCLELAVVSGTDPGNRGTRISMSGQILRLNCLGDTILETGGDFYLYGGELNVEHNGQLGTFWAVNAINNTGASSLNGGFSAWAPVTAGGGLNPAVWKVFGPGGQKWEARIGDDTGFAPIIASEYQIGSAIDGKTDVRPAIVAATPKVKDIRTVNFKRPPVNMIDADGKRLGPNPSPTIRRNEDRDRLGWIAEDVFAIVPEAVVVDENNAPQGIDLAHMVALLWKANQELEGRLLALESP